MLLWLKLVLGSVPHEEDYSDFGVDINLGVSAVAQISAFFC